MRILLARFGIGRLGVSATTMSIALLLRGAILALYLLAITHWLGAQDYGVFIAAVTTSAILAPFAGWGAAQLLMQRVSAHPGLLVVELKAAIWQLTFTGMGLSAVSLFIAKLLNIEMHAAELLIVSASELVLLPATLLVATACQAMGDTPRAAVAICLSPFMRLLTLGVVIAIGAAGSSTTAALIHLVGTLLAAIISLHMIKPLLSPGIIRPRPHDRITRATRGTRYALGNAAGSAYLEIDKLLIIALVGSGALGPYIIAFRVAALAGMPIAGLSSVILPRLFASQDTAKRTATGRAMLITSAIYGALATITLVLASPWLPSVFGKDFGDASHYLLLLSPWPLLYACKIALATQLTGTGKQGTRAIIEIGGVAVSVLTGWAMIASHGAAGAAIALLAAEASMVTAMALYQRRRGRPETERVR